MKRVIALILTLFIICSLCTACGGNGETNETQAPTVATVDPSKQLSDGKTLKVLAIGNSFSNNTTEYLYDVAMAEGMTDVVIGRLYIGGCTLAMHVENAQTDSPAYKYYKNNSGVWNTTDSVTLKYALQDEQWDIITLQQGSGTSGVANTYKESLDTLITYVNENKTNPDAKLVWHMTWAYQQGSDRKSFAQYSNDQWAMYNAIVDAVQKVVVPNEQIQGIIPVGTAIQNARTSFIGDNLTKDTYHLNVLGEVIGAYTWYATFTGRTLTSINLTTVGNELTLTDNDKAAVIDAINSAILTPFAVTMSSVTNK